MIRHKKSSRCQITFGRKARFTYYVARLKLDLIPQTHSLMNAERLHAIATALQADLSKSGVLSNLQQLISALSNQVSQPNQPHYQQQTSQFYSALVEGLKSSSVNEFSPTWQQALEELGARPLLGITLAKHVEDIFSRNQITPSVAQQELQVLVNEMQSLSTAVDQLLTSFRTLKIGKEDLAPGECELGVLVPRAFVENRLDRFADELDELNRIFGVFAELSTGSRPSFVIKTISSTDLSIFLEVGAIVGACVATAVERIIALYKNLLEVRKLQGELVKQGVDKKHLEGLETHANELMDTGVDKLVKDLLQEFKGKVDAGRKNELSVELKYSLKKIANRIDRGFNIEVRMEEPAPLAESDKKSPAEVEALASHERIRSATGNLQFLKLEGEPILRLREGKDEKSKS
jgi:hypothetical protein